MLKFSLGKQRNEGRLDRPLDTITTILIDKHACIISCIYISALYTVVPPRHMAEIQREAGRRSQLKIKGDLVRLGNLDLSSIVDLN